MTFVGKKGIFLNGSIRPPLEGVAITLKHKTDDALVFTVNADKQGNYKYVSLKIKIIYSNTSKLHLFFQNRPS